MSNIIDEVIAYVIPRAKFPPISFENREVEVEKTDDRATFSAPSRTDDLVRFVVDDEEGSFSAVSVYYWTSNGVEKSSARFANMPASIVAETILAGLL